jgi:hypothetical protein
MYGKIKYDMEALKEGAAQPVTLHIGVALHYIHFILV